ncbi:TOBE domain-containing protein [Cohnella nanjingensis]|uniref:TOBE domain-containing protein n=1 Tax=Cohnella nanjingensis TaxID=1387779 RepID=UPI0035E4665D
MASGSSPTATTPDDPHRAAASLPADPIAASGGGQPHYVIRGRIATREMLGAETIYQVRGYENPALAFMVKCFSDPFAVDQAVELGVPADKLFFFDAQGDRIRRDHPKHGAYLEALRRGPSDA